MRKIKKYIRFCILYISVLSHLNYLKLFIYHPALRGIMPSFAA
jgi:hypothetical protein